MIDGRRTAREELDALLAEGIDGAVQRECDTFERLAPFGTRVVLFGAGGLGRRVLAGLRSYGIEPLAFCDNNPKLWGTQVDGLAVLTPPAAASIFGAEASFVVTVWGALGNDRMRDRIAQLRALGCDATDDAEASEELPGLLTALARSVGIEPGLGPLGVTEADLAGFAAAAAGITRLTQNNPRPVDAQALYGVLRDALHAGN